MPSARLPWRYHAPPRDPDIAVTVSKEYRLPGPTTARELHEHHPASVGRGPWRLTHTDADNLSYRRRIDGYRLVSVMTIDERRLSIRTTAWTGATPCGAEAR